MKRFINRKPVKLANSVMIIIAVLALLLPDNVSAQENFRETFSPRYTRAQTQKFKDSVMLSGDWNSAAYISWIYDKEFSRMKNGDDNTYELEIPYLLVLANRYNDGRACYAIYNETRTMYHGYGLEMDHGTIEFLLYYLTKGAELGDAGCCRELCVFYTYGIYVEADADKAKKYRDMFEYSFKECGMPILEIRPPRPDEY
ncbi:MAG: hypothetical protein IJT51_06480 [Bacteroidales bacterium]|nr:hypothetical protein [Bacteroidales bacterium]